MRIATMPPTKIDTPVHVQARTDDEEIVPILMIWGKKRYPFSQVRSRQVTGERITMSSKELGEVVLECDYARKSWRLISIG